MERLINMYNNMPIEEPCEGCQPARFYYNHIDSCVLKNDGYEKRCPCQTCIVKPMCNDYCHKMKMLMRERWQDIQEVQIELIKSHNR